MKKRKVWIAMAGFIALIVISVLSVEAEGSKTMYVVTATDGREWWDYTYDSNGLLTKAVVPDVFGQSAVVEKNFSYKNGKLTKMTGTDNSLQGNFITTYKYDGKGRLKSYKHTFYNTYSNEVENCLFSYDDNNQVEEIEMTGRNVNGNYKNALSYQYDKNGLPIKEAGQGYTNKYQYDRKGNEVKFVTAYDGKESCKNIYDKKGRLVKRKWLDVDEDTTFQYKRVKVPVKYVDIVKCQQRELLNPDVPIRIMDE